MTEFIPHEYQKYCIERVYDTEALALFLEPGLGKTVITLTAIKELKYSRFQVGKVLVIAPKKVAESTWAREAKKWNHLGLLRISSVLGSQQKRMRALSMPADIYITNRENVTWIVDYYRNEWPFDMVVIDELSSFKSHQAKRFKSLVLVRDRIKRIVGLTGTPAPNGLIDLWAQVYLLDQGERLGKYITHYRQRYFDPDQRNQERVFNYKPKNDSAETIKRLIGDICISMKAEDYLELPDCIMDQRIVMLDDKAQKSYDKLEKEMLLQIDEQLIDAGSAAVLNNKLLQLCNGAVYGENREVVAVHDCKIEAFMELVEELNGNPALVFYSFQHDIPRLEKALKKTGLRVRVLKTPQDETDWNNREIDILLAHPASCAYGLNLQDGGNHVIWFGLNWSLELYQQANKRLHRQGQQQKVFIHLLTISGGIDEDVVKALDGKSDTQEMLMLALKARIEKHKGGAS